VKERLQKILARAGYGSRRSAEALIASGRVRVNGAVARELGTQADAMADHIEVDDKLIEPDLERMYLAMYKPRGVLSSARDARGRRTVMDLLPARTPHHVLPVGRLDLDTEGLLLFTNDGELAHRLAHPRYEIEKEYAAQVVGDPPAGVLDRLRRGVLIEGRRTAPARVTVTKPPHGYDARPGHTWLLLVLHEGRKRQVRLMCAAVGHPVRTLVRTRIGDVSLGRQARGTTRALSKREVDALSRAVGL
jgi:23S rRNA pseudouridine2605 synthase